MNKNDENKIFVITTGEYSDYRIDRIFSSRKLANEYLDTVDDSYTLEVYDLDEPIRHTTAIYCIEFLLTAKKVMRTTTKWGKDAPLYKDLIRAKNDRLYIYIESDSRKRALKVASERYGAIIAGEQTMFPYLRVGVIKLHSYGAAAETAYHDFHTGEIVLFDEQQFAAPMPPFIKSKRRGLNG